MQSEVLEIIGINDKVTIEFCFAAYKGTSYQPPCRRFYPATRKSHRARAMLVLMVWATLQDPETGWTALHYACLRGNEEIVKELLKVKADVGALDSPYCQVAFTFLRLCVFVCVCVCLCF